jgi:hypothetical protein
MTVCPIALAVGCKKCPVFAVCPVKGVIGDYKKDESPPKREPGKTKSSAKARK